MSRFVNVLFLKFLPRFILVTNTAKETWIFSRWLIFCKKTWNSWNLNLEKIVWLTAILVKVYFKVGLLVTFYNKQCVSIFSSNFINFLWIIQKEKCYYHRMFYFILCYWTGAEIICFINNVIHCDMQMPKMLRVSISSIATTIK